MKYKFVNFPVFLLVAGILTKSGRAYRLVGVRGAIWNYRLPSKPCRLRSKKFILEVATSNLQK